MFVRVCLIVHCSVHTDVVLPLGRLCGLLLPKGWEKDLGRWLWARGWKIAHLCVRQWDVIPANIPVMGLVMCELP